MPKEMTREEIYEVIEQIKKTYGIRYCSTSEEVVDCQPKFVTLAIKFKVDTQKNA